MSINKVINKMYMLCHYLTFKSEDEVIVNFQAGESEDYEYLDFREARGFISTNKSNLINMNKGEYLFSSGQRRYEGTALVRIVGVKFEGEMARVGIPNYKKQCLSYFIVPRDNLEIH